MVPVGLETHPTPVVTDPVVVEFCGDDLLGQRPLFRYFRCQGEAPSSIPACPQFRHVLPAFLVEKETGDDTILGKEGPFGQVAMLKNPPAFTIVLAHRAEQPLDRFGRHTVGHPQFPPRHVESFFVPVQVPVKEVGVLVVPQGQLQRPPTPFFVHEDLPAFELGFIAVLDSAERPYRTITCQAPEIRPEDRTGFLELGRMEQALWILDRNVVRVQEQDFSIRTVNHGVRLEFPTVQNSRWMHLPHFPAVDTLHSQRSQKGLHLPIHLALSQIPELDR